MIDKPKGSVAMRLAKAIPERRNWKAITREKAANEIAQALNNIPYEAAMLILDGLCATGDVRWVDDSGEIADEDVVTIAAYKSQSARVRCCR